MTGLGADSNPARPASARPVHPAAGGPSATVRLLDAVAAEAGRRGRPDLQVRLARERGRLVTPDALVVVAGEFKKGKGTLVNALLGAAVCGTDPISTTLVPTMVGYAPHPTATVRRAARSAPGDAPTGGAPPTAAAPAEARSVEDPSVDAVSIEVLHDLVQGPPAATRLAIGSDSDSDSGTGTGSGLGTGSGTGPVSSAQVGVPRQLLAQGLTLLDTPGLNGGLADGHAAATLDAAVSADAVLFVSDAGQELTAPELDLIRRLVRQGGTVLLAITKIDACPHWRRVVAANREHLRRAGLDLTVFPLGAPLRLRALRDHRPDLDTESGYPALVTHLRHEIVAPRRARLERLARATAADALRQLLTELETERAALADPRHDAGDRAAGLAAAVRDASRMGEPAAVWRQELSQQYPEMTLRCRDGLAASIRTLHARAEERITASDPSEQWDELRSWLFQAVNETLLDHRQQIRSEGTTLVDTVTQAFEAAAGPVRELLATAVDRPLPTVEDVRGLEFTQSTGFDLLAQGARGGSVGMVIVSAGGALASIAGLAALTTVLAPVGIGALVMLGRRTIASVRANERRAHQAHAKEAARQYIEQAGRIIAQDATVVCEQLRVSLHQALTGLATELTTEARRNLAAAERAGRETEESHQARLAALDRDIARLRAVTEAASAPGAGDPAGAAGAARAVSTGRAGRGAAR
ncbi:Dynamin family protein [Parafrankia irregularis]|uniref:Dynamin family protein n=1 Tax=Parafrankia irregularis TaxID=795642 RepID=A0A0S4QV24_9ACTN|nr:MULTISPECIES: dynamin family protein [Parafrankia]MBE3202511.1 dynamin family protein [Parafrankia sp. CH37]CUU59563.1 Dynamin family protein [Parafrankia irregularis]